MRTIHLTVQTRKGKEFYRVRFLGGRFSVFHRRRLFWGVHLTVRIGESSTQTGALECVQSSSQGTILYTDYGAGGR
jgi:regulator of RNase E activity RraA